MMDTIHLTQKNKPLMIAHRGVSGLEMENTASAFVAAGQRSYFGVETDVHRTADGRYIIIHDDTTRRVAGDEMVVEQTSYETLRSLRLLDVDGQKGRRDLILPSLGEYIGICKKYGKAAVLELKNHFDGSDLDQIIEEIRALDYLTQTIFISFDLANLVYIRERLPEQNMQYLVETISDGLRDTLIRYRLDLDIHYQALTGAFTALLHQNGLRVNVWTVNTLEDARRMMDLGVDFITSNILE